MDGPVSGVQRMEYVCGGTDGGQNTGGKPGARKPQRSGQKAGASDGNFNIGYKENAGIFCHNNPWISIAETVIGRGNRAWQVYTRTCPAYIEDISEIHRTEPYVYSQMIAGKDAPNFGEAKNSWLTGTAAWTFLDVSQFILGIRPDYDGLTVDPCIPSKLDGFTAKRDFRGVSYHITVKNPNHVEKGVLSMIVDGQPVEGTTIPFSAEKKDVNVEVTMG